MHALFAITRNDFIICMSDLTIFMRMVPQGIFKLSVSISCFLWNAEMSEDSLVSSVCTKPTSLQLNKDLWGALGCIGLFLPSAQETLATPWENLMD